MRGGPCQQAVEAGRGHPVGRVQPGTSTINFPLGDIRANGVTVPLAAGGKLDFMYWTSRTGPTVQIVFDVTGYFG